MADVRQVVKRIGHIYSIKRRVGHIYPLRRVLEGRGDQNKTKNKE